MVARGATNVTSSGVDDATSSAEGEGETLQRGFEVFSACWRSNASSKDSPPSGGVEKSSIVAGVADRGALLSAEDAISEWGEVTTSGALTCDAAVSWVSLASRVGAKAGDGIDSALIERTIGQPQS